MKICEIREHQLDIRNVAIAERFGISPFASALRMLVGALETVNRAGLDGKELSDLHLVRRSERGEMVFEVHAKVRHRLREKS